MKGVYTIEAENTDGDRRIVVRIDGESHSPEEARTEAENELRQPGVYRIRVYQDTGATYRFLYSITI